ncbi:MAG TPA: PQQ-binding-like beta-propeller repeat protein [Caulobacteraceae bacterium]|jgi:alcohol dehydrogenase (cytochrome c)|nr:PQQ-binding-like beta-propeller repeat protein [Caulobacteraceae bacterium]
MTMLRMRGAARALLPAILAMAAVSAAAQVVSPAGGPPAGGGFPSLRNEDTAYQAAERERLARLARITPVSDAMLADPPAGDWLVWRRAYDGTGYSPLDQIDRRNVAGLVSTWNWSLPVSPNEITPLAHDGVLFVASANRVQAIDGETGDLLWQYTRPLPPALAGGAQAIAKNIAIYEDRLIVTTADRHIVALEARSGKLLWDHEVLPAGVVGPRMTGGPLVAKGVVMMGMSNCNAYKGGCFVVGLDARTGTEKWKFYTIARPDEPGGDSWNGAPLDERFGGAVWTSGSYDPELGLAYWGLGQTYNSATLLAPRPGQATVGNNDGLYTDATVALDPATGKLAWHYQHMNRDVWDMDWVFERTLVTLPVGGRNRKVALTAGKLGIFDAVDRANGQYLFSKDLGIQNLVKAIDPKTGKKQIEPAFDPAFGEARTICPHAGGARSWPATAFDPKTRIVYIPLVDTCMDFTRRARTAEETAAGGSDLSWVVRARPGSNGNIGRVDAVDLATMKTVWSSTRRAPESAALLATAGGVLFEGSRDRMFRALDSATGKTLWETRLAAQPSSFPITYAVKGVQYVAVVSGGGGAHDITWPQITPEIDNPVGATTLYVFRLPGRR